MIDIYNLKSFKKQVTFEAPPKDIFELLIDSRKHSVLTGTGASISRKKGGKFSVYAGDIIGENIEIVKNKRIVQLWRINTWPEGFYSKVTISLYREKQKTRLVIFHRNIPVEFFDEVLERWNVFYWDRIKKVLRGGR